MQTGLNENLKADEAFITAEEAAQILRVSVCSLKRYVKDNLVPYRRIGPPPTQGKRGGVLRFLRSELLGAPIQRPKIGRPAKFRRGAAR